MEQNDPGKTIGGAAAGCGTGCLTQFVIGIIIMFAAMGGITGEGSEAMMPGWTIPAGLILSVLTGVAAGFVCRKIAKNQKGIFIMAGISALYSIFAIFKAVTSEAAPEMTAEQQKALEDSPEFLQLLTEAGVAAQNGPLWPSIVGAALLIGGMFLGGNMAAKSEDPAPWEDHVEPDEPESGAGAS